MKDLREAVKEFDERDAERVRKWKDDAFWSGRPPPLEATVELLNQRLQDVCQLMAWIIGHIEELEKKENDNG